MKFKIGMLTIALLVLLFGSCKQISINTHPYPTTDNIVLLTDGNMPPIECFSTEKVELPEEYANAEYYVYNDSVVVIVNSTHPSPYMVTFYNLNKQNVIAGFFTKGRGPDEFISVMAQMHRNCLYIRDGNSYALSCLNIDSVLIKGDSYKPAIVRMENMMSAFVYVGGDTITMTNKMYINDGFGVEGLPEFIQFDAKTGTQLTDYKQNDKNFPANLVQRSLVYCNSKYVAFWNCFPIITIYDKDFNLVKMLRDNKMKDPDVVIDEGDGALLADGLNSFFTFGCQTDDYVFVQNLRCQIGNDEIKRRGGLKWRMSDDYFFGKFENEEIWCFDNSMNLVRRFKCVDRRRVIAKTSYNEKSKNLFVTATDDEKEYCLYKCVLKEGE